MKKLILFSVALLFSMSIFAQIQNKRKQVSPRLNLSLSPYVGLANIAGNFNVVAGGSLKCTINDRFYYGLTINKKVQKTFVDYELSGQRFDLVLHAGVAVGGYIDLGIYETKSGRYAKRKTKLTYGVNFDGSAFWAMNESGDKISSREYFYTYYPSVGFLRPIGNFVDLELGVKYQGTLNIDEDWEAKYNLTNSDFSGVGGYVAVKFNLFH